MTTDFLKDEGEEYLPTKLHVGCGGIYLPGYINVDISGKVVRSPSEVPERNRANILDYYNEDGTLEKLPKRRETYMDASMDMRNTGLAVNSVDKIIAIQCLEHLSPYDVRMTLLHWWNILKPGGSLVLSVPDVDETLDMLINGEDPNIVVRLLRGSMRDDYAAHISWFTKSELVRLLVEETHFEEPEWLPNFHLYPALVLRTRKKDLYMPGREYQEIPDLPEDAKVLDVGPGKFPYPMATHYLDKVKRRDLRIPWTKWDLDDRTEPLPFVDGAFDYVNCSHVLEHVQDPIAVYQELLRVGKAGRIEVPSMLIDFTFQFGSQGHNLWNCQHFNGCLLMVPRDVVDNRFFSEGQNSLGRMTYIATHSLINTLTSEQIRLRNFFWEWQDRMNVSIFWNQHRTQTLFVLDPQEGLIQWPE